MRRTLGTVGALALLTGGVVACSSQSISDAQLGFNVVESLLLVSDSDPTVGTVVLGSTRGNCPLFQEGASFVQIGSSAFLTFALEALQPDFDAGPLTAGTYTIIIPGPTLPPDAGLYATSTEYETTDVCAYSPTGANSGTLTIQPFTRDAGGDSVATYTVVFGLSRFNGTYPLATCVIPASAPAFLDAGTCLLPGRP